MRILKVMGLLSLVCACGANAEAYVPGKILKVLTPTKMLVDVEGYNASGKLRVQLKGIAPAKDESTACEAPNLGEGLCDYLKDEYVGERVNIIIEDKTDDGVVGDVMLDGQSVVRQLVLAGIYRVDYTQTRTQNLLLAEKEARCQYRGMWRTKRGDPYIAKQCQL